VVLARKENKARIEVVPEESEDEDDIRIYQEPDPEKKESFRGDSEVQQPTDTIKEEHVNDAVTVFSDSKTETKTDEKTQKEEETNSEIESDEVLRNMEKEIYTAKTYSCTVNDQTIQTVLQTTSHLKEVQEKIMTEEIRVEQVPIAEMLQTLEETKNDSSNELKNNGDVQIHASIHGQGNKNTFLEVTEVEEAKKAIHIKREEVKNALEEFLEETISEDKTKRETTEMIVNLAESDHCIIPTELEKEIEMVEPCSHNYINDEDVQYVPNNPFPFKEIKEEKMVEEIIVEQVPIAEMMQVPNEKNYAAPNQFETIEKQQTHSSMHVDTIIPAMELSLNNNYEIKLQEKTHVATSDYEKDNIIIASEPYLPHLIKKEANIVQMSSSDVFDSKNATDKIESIELAGMEEINVEATSDIVASTCKDGYGNTNKVYGNTFMDVVTKAPSKSSDDTNQGVVVDNYNNVNDANASIKNEIDLIATEIQVESHPSLTVNEMQQIAEEIIEASLSKIENEAFNDNDDVCQDRFGSSWDEEDTWEDYDSDYDFDSHKFKGNVEGYVEFEIGVWNSALWTSEAKPIEPHIEIEDEFEGWGVPFDNAAMSMYVYNQYGSDLGDLNWQRSTEKTDTFAGSNANKEHRDSYSDICDSPINEPDDSVSTDEGIVASDEDDESGKEKSKDVSKQKNIVIDKIAPAVVSA